MVMVGYMYEEVKKGDVVVGRERERGKAREREGRHYLLLASAEWK